MAYNIFDYVKQINSKRNDIKFNSKECPKYMLTLHYGQSNNFINISNDINRFLFLIYNDKIIYNYFFSKIPKGNHFIKWPKKNKKEYDKEIKEFAEKNDISTREARLLIKE